jgi:aryl-alcohol dehydrogenase-like predicted oxidoreductase
MALPTPPLASHEPRPPITTVLPPLVLGTGTFNTQFVEDPSKLPSTAIVSRALELGIRAFDTSPYYGPSETLLGLALSTIQEKARAEGQEPPAPFLITKCGRIGPFSFDYSPQWIRRSIHRSLQRLHTRRLDLVYTHDVEFVKPEEVLAAVTELRRLRDEEGVIRYVGISGYPVDVLARLAEYIKQETGEAVDAVLSYGHFTLQNTELARAELDALDGVKKHSAGNSVLARFRAAGVGAVLNASILGMGLLTSSGIPVADPSTSTSTPGSALTPPDSNPPSPSRTAGTKSAAPTPLQKWHPSPDPLRLACKQMSKLCQEAEPPESLENVAIRWALDQYSRIGAEAGLGVALAPESETTVGATVLGVTRVSELEDSVAEWEGVVAGLSSAGTTQLAEKEKALQRRKQILNLVHDKLWPALGEWRDYGWASPAEGWVNQPPKHEPESS